MSPVAELVPVLIWMSNADKRCTYVNTAWMAFTGRTLGGGARGRMARDRFIPTTFRGALRFLMRRSKISPRGRLETHRPLS